MSRPEPATITPTQPSAAERLVRSVYRLSLVQRALGRHALEELGSHGFLALATVHKHGPVRVSDVAQHLCVDLSVASRQVTALVDAGYAERTPDPDDRRAQLNSLTDAGRRVLRESHQRMIGAFSTALADWPDADVGDLADRLDRLRDDFVEHSTPSARPQEIPS